MNILDWIDVGKIAAERDENLSHYFFDNGVTKSVVENQSTFLVLGRKGAGKTAVFRHLSENPDKYLPSQDTLVALSFEDYNWNIHSQIKKREAAASLVYKQSWKFVILVEALKAYYRTLKDEQAKVPKKLKAALKLLEKLFDKPLPTIYQIIGRKILSLSKIKLPSLSLDVEEGRLDSAELGGGEVGFDEIGKNESLQEQLSTNIDNLIFFLEQTLESLELETSGRRIFVCFDRVDEAWDSVSLDSSQKVIAGLVSASDSISSKHGKYLRPVVFLREDIFETLSLNDANKLREDCGALLHWNKDSIFKVLLARLNHFASVAGAPAIEDIDSLFDKRKMRQGVKPSSYMLKRSMMRPRDMICFFKRILSVMKDRADDPFADEPVAEFEQLPTDAVYEAEPGYSEWLKKELIDEWGAQYPDIKRLLEILQNNGLTNIEHGSLLGEIAKFRDAATQARVMEDVTFLFENSVIGLKVGGSTAWRFKCFYPAQGFVESISYHIHDGLIRALNLKEPRETKKEAT